MMVDVATPDIADAHGRDHAAPASCTATRMIEDPVFERGLTFASPHDEAPALSLRGHHVRRKPSRKTPTRYCPQVLLRQSITETENPQLEPGLGIVRLARSRSAGWRAGAQAARAFSDSDAAARRRARPRIRCRSAHAEFRDLATLRASTRYYNWGLDRALGAVLESDEREAPQRPHAPNTADPTKRGNCSDECN